MTGGARRSNSFFILLVILGIVVLGTILSLYWVDLSQPALTRAEITLHSTTALNTTSSLPKLTISATTTEVSNPGTVKPTAATTTTQAPKPTTTATTQPKPTTPPTTTVPTTTLPPKSYAGKLWYAIGDSITNSGLYPDILVRNMGFRYYYNDGIPATCMSTMADRVTHDKLATFDLVTVFAGTNDYGEGTPLGSAQDDATVDSFYGHIHKVIGKLQTAAPTIEIVFMTPIVRGAYAHQPVFPDPNDAGFTLNDYRQAIKTVCAEYNIKVIDLYATSGISIDNVGQYTDDFLHPNWDGAALIAQAIQRGLER